MNKNIFMFLSVALVLLVPVPGRLAYGLVMSIEFIFLMLAGILLRNFISKIKMEEFQHFLIPIIVLALAIIYRQIIVMISPVIAFTLGYTIYMPAVSAFLLESLAEEKSKSVFIDIKKKLTVTLSISLPILIVFLMRDIIGYGTLTLPAHNGLLTFHIIPETVGAEKFLPTVFFASIPGAFVSLAICIVYINKFGLKWLKRKDVGKSDITSENNGMESNEKVSPPQTPVLEESHTEQSPSGDSFGTQGFAFNGQNPSENSSFPEAPSLLNLQDLLGETNVD